MHLVYYTLHIIALVGTRRMRILYLTFAHALFVLVLLSSIWQHVCVYLANGLCEDATMRC